MWLSFHTRSSGVGGVKKLKFQTGKNPTERGEIDLWCSYFPASSNSKLEATLNKQKSSLQGVLGSSDVIRKSPPSWTPPFCFQALSGQHIFNHCVEP